SRHVEGELKADGQYRTSMGAVSGAVKQTQLLSLLRQELVRSRTEELRLRECSGRSTFPGRSCAAEIRKQFYWTGSLETFLAACRPCIRHQRQRAHVHSSRIWAVHGLSAFLPVWRL